MNINEALSLNHIIVLDESPINMFIFEFENKKIEISLQYVMLNSILNFYNLKLLIVYLDSLLILIDNKKFKLVNINEPIKINDYLFEVK